MTAIRTRDVSVPSVIPDEPGEIDTTVEQHPSGAVRVRFDYRGAWKVDVHTRGPPSIDRAYRDGALVRSPPGWVERLVRAAVGGV